MVHVRAICSFLPCLASLKLLFLAVTLLVLSCTMDPGCVSSQPPSNSFIVPAYLLFPLTLEVDSISEAARCVLRLSCMACLVVMRMVFMKTENSISLLRF